jgi:tetratricopeptide (TPR) repeat protein
MKFIRLDERVVRCQMKPTKTTYDSINKLFEAGRFIEARRMLLALVDQVDDPHWELNYIAKTYYKDDDVITAFEYNEKARELQPLCPNVMWDYAGLLDATGRHEESIREFRKIIRRGAPKIAASRCGEGLQYARALVNDSRFRLASIYRYLGYPRKAAYYYRKHFANRGPGIPSSFTLREVKQDYKQFLSLRSKMPDR